MAELGYATLLMNYEDGSPVDCYSPAAEAQADHELQVAILRIETDDRTINIAMRRGELNHLLAHPNSTTQIEASVTDETHDHDYTEAA